MDEIHGITTCLKIYFYKYSHSIIKETKKQNHKLYESLFTIMIDIELITRKFEITIRLYASELKMKF